MSVIIAKTLREKTSLELQDQMNLEKKRLFDGIVKGASGETIKAHEKREGRRLIARIQSILRERELRSELDKSIGVLTLKAKGAAPLFEQVIKDVDQRVAEINAELAKPVGKRKHKPMVKRNRMRLRDGESKQPDRDALRLAEVRRRRACVQREDVGQGR
jgi:ribosomal protein L29